MKIKSSKIDDIAREAGVSPSTVSRVFNNRPYVKEELRKRVFEAAAKLDYAPKSVARKEVISVVVGVNALTGNSFETAMISSFAAAATKQGVLLEIVPIDELDRVYQNFSNAVIAAVYSNADIEKLKTIRNVPVLTVNCITGFCSYVCSDHEESAYAAADCLIRHGRRNIAILFAPYERSMTWGETARLAGYRRALKEHQIALRRELIVYGARECLDQIGRLLLAERPDAVIACGESLALPVRYALELFHKRIPEDIAMVSYYAPGITPYLLPAPTCIRQDFARISALAMENALALGRGEKRRVEIVLKDEFIIGKSI